MLATSRPEVPKNGRMPHDQPEVAASSDGEHAAYEEFQSARDVLQGLHADPQVVDAAAAFVGGNALADDLNEFNRLTNRGHKLAEWASHR
jgi:hypothetical protein